MCRMQCLGNYLPQLVGLDARKASYLAYDYIASKFVHTGTGKRGH